MRVGFAGIVVIIVALIVLIAGYGSLFTVYQTRQALVVRLGNPQRVETEPGLHFKVPMIDSVIYIDKRILDIENSAQEILASDSKPLIVDAFARYRVKDPLKFYQAVGTTEGANARLSPQDVERAEPAIGTRAEVGAHGRGFDPPISLYRDGTGALGIGDARRYDDGHETEYDPREDKADNAQSSDKTATHFHSQRALFDPFPDSMPAPKPNQHHVPTGFFPIRNPTPSRVPLLMNPRP